MAYSEFTSVDLIRKFKIKFDAKALFSTVEEKNPSQ